MAAEVVRVAAARGLFRGTKVVCVAKNYGAHKVEMGGTAERLSEPAIFLKPRSSVVHAPGRIERPRAVRELHHEVELGVVIGRGGAPRAAPGAGRFGGRRGVITAASWESHVAGYVLALDMTARDHQAKAKQAGMPWTLGKCWDSFTPMSSTVARRLVKDPHALELQLSVDGVERQRASTGLMLHRVPELLEFISGVMTLEPGDVVLTGTPEGVGAVVGGNVVRAELRDGSKVLSHIEFAVHDQDF